MVICLFFHEKTITNVKYDGEKYTLSTDFANEYLIKFYILNEIQRFNIDFDDKFHNDYVLTGMICKRSVKI